LKLTYETTVNAEVVFTEKLTGKIVNAIGSVYIAQYGYEMIITSSDYFQAGTPYNLVVSMRKVGTGTPVNILEYTLNGFESTSSTLYRLQPELPSQLLTNNNPGVALSLQTVNGFAHKTRRQFQRQLAHLGQFL
jgi:hypothetical protein